MKTRVLAVIYILFSGWAAESLPIIKSYVTSGWPTLLATQYCGTAYYVPTHYTLRDARVKLRDLGGAKNAAIYVQMELTPAAVSLSEEVVRHEILDCQRATSFHIENYPDTYLDLAKDDIQPEGIRTVLRPHFDANILLRALNLPEIENKKPFLGFKGVEAVFDRMRSSLVISAYADPAHISARRLFEFLSYVCENLLSIKIAMRQYEFEARASVVADYNAIAFFKEHEYVAESITHHFQRCWGAGFIFGPIRCEYWDKTTNRMETETVFESMDLNSRITIETAKGHGVPDSKVQDLLDQLWERLRNNVFNEKFVADSRDVTSITPGVEKKSLSVDGYKDELSTTHLVEKQINTSIWGEISPEASQDLKSKIDSAYSSNSVRCYLKGRFSVSCVRKYLKK